MNKFDLSLSKVSVKQLNINLKYMYKGKKVINKLKISKINK